MRKTLNVALIAILLLSLAAGAALAKDEFKGMVQQLPPHGFLGTWVIDGTLVQVTSETKLEFEHGPAQVGSFVEVKGVNRDGGFFATKIEAKRPEK